MEGDVALPRSNGELVFSAPPGRPGLWQCLCAKGWRSVSMGGASRLSDHRDRADNQVETSAYYEEWLAALEKFDDSDRLPHH